MYPPKLMHATPPSQAGKGGSGPGLPIHGPMADSIPGTGAAFPPPSAEFLVLLTWAIDLVVTLAALVYATSADQHLGLRAIVRDVLVGQYSSYILMGWSLYMIVLGYMGAYQRHFFFSSSRTLQVVAKSACTWIVVFLALSLAVKLQPPVSRYFFFFSFLNSWIFLSAWRLAFCHFLLESKWNVAFRKKVLVVGWSKESDVLFDKILRDPGHAYEVIGCTPSAHGKFWVRPPSQVTVLGDYNSLQEIIRGAPSGHCHHGRPRSGHGRDHRAGQSVRARERAVQGHPLLLPDPLLRSSPRACQRRTGAGREQAAARPYVQPHREADVRRCRRGRGAAHLGAAHRSSSAS